MATMTSPAMTAMGLILGTAAYMAPDASNSGNALDIGTPEKLFDIHTQWHAPNQPHNPEVAANGQRFLVNTIVGNSDNEALEVTVNWMKALKK